MKVVLIFLSIMLPMILGLAVGYAMAKTELRRRVRQDMEREGWSRKHMLIYHAAINTLNKIVRAYELDAPMEFRVVQLPDNLRSDAQNVINRYREESGA